MSPEPASCPIPNIAKQGRLKPDCPPGSKATAQDQVLLWHPGRGVLVPFGQVG